MSTEQCKMEASWKRPDELMKLQRLKLKKKQLAARLNQNNNNNNNNSSGKLEINESDKAKLLEAKIAQKRKNPFAKATDNDTKKLKPDVDMQEESLLGFVERVPTIEPHTLTPVPAEPAFIKETPTRPVPAKLVLKPFNAAEFSKLLHARNTEDAAQADVELEQQKYTRHLPMDWSLKTRVRFFSRSELPATVLKTSQMASGLTSFVRCIDQQQQQQGGESGLDISPATRFNQATYYWQHPHLPWLTLFPRNSKDNIGQIVGERERKALAEDWDYSFRGLFQLLRARQCPYFYLCANTFTVLFRAAGVGGRAEVHAMMSPSTRGMRSALRQEGIEFSMPLKKDSALNKSGDAHNSDESNSLNVSGEAAEGGSNSNEGNTEKGVAAADDEDDDEEEEDEWLESLGVDEKEIRKIQATHNRKVKAQEMLDDFSDISLLLMEGVECQGFFSFLLNAKSTISSVGRLAGVPPTLLAPVGFPKATMQHLSARSKKVRMDGVDYCSIEIKGIVMPTFMPYVCQMLGETKDTFSATMATSPVTLAFSKATQKLLEDPEKTDEPHQEEGEAAGQVFGQENLSDCGLGSGVIQSICRTGQHAVSLLERVCYDKEHGYAWS